MKTSTLTKLVAGLLLFFLFPVAESYSQTASIGKECQLGFGSEVVGIGPRSQTIIHYRLFMNRFHAPAERSADGTLKDASVKTTSGCRDDAQSLVHYAGASDSVILRALINRMTDPLRRPYRFFALNRPLTPVEAHRAESELESLRSEGTAHPILHLPVWIEGITVAYNLNCPTGNPRDELRLSSPALSGIFSGAITHWNDELIYANNIQLAQCDQAIRVAVRADQGEQTTVFKDYMSKRNPQWAPFAAAEANTQWPPTLIGPCRGRGDEGVTTCVTGRSGSIGYVRMPEAFASGLKLASVENASTGFVPPSLEGCTEAGNSPSARIPDRAEDDWSQASLTDPVDPPGGTPMYAICGIQYVLAFKQYYLSTYRSGQQASGREIRTVKDYIKWALLDSTQSAFRTYQLSELSSKLKSVSRNGVASIVYQ